VGVFVNANPEYILRSVKKYDLQYVQLHGNEAPDYCRSLQNRGINIIKAFRVDGTFNFSMVNNYKAYADLFLFDAKGVSRVVTDTPSMERAEELRQRETVFHQRWYWPRKPRPVATTQGMKLYGVM
jgi:phosphoribosylanthranilate isomerase